MNNEFYLCPNCNHCIPEINRVVHAVRCSQPIQPPPVVEIDDENNMMEEEEEEEVVAELPEAQVVHNLDDSDIMIENVSGFGWDCEVCTFKNHNQGSRVCEMCGKTRFPNEIPSEPTRQQSRPTEQNQQSSSSSSSSSSSHTWQCGKCTYVNERTDDQCRMCGDSIRPAAAAYRDQLIPTYEEDEEGMPVSSRTTFVYRTPPATASMNSGELISPMVLGAGIGAGVAYLNNRPVLQGSLQGAGMGAMGGMLMQLLQQEQQAQQRQQQQQLLQHHMMMQHAQQAGGLYRPNYQRNADPFFDNDEDEDEGGHDHIPPMILQQLLGHHLITSPPRPRGLDPRMINNLPVHSFEPLTANNESIQQCSICLESFQAGDRIRMIPCLHKFHVTCIDQWFRQSHHCPVCKYEIR